MRTSDDNSHHLFIGDQAIGAAIFDLDGTLLRFNFNWKDSRQKMINWLSENGFDASGLSIRNRTAEMLDAARQQLQSESIRCSYEEVRRSIFGILEYYEIESSLNSFAFPESHSLLRKLHSAGIPLAIVTNSGRLTVDRVLKTHGFLPFLSVVVTRNDVENMKPYPEGILKAIAELKLPGNDVVYIGDSIEDVRAARRAEVISVALAQGLYSRSELVQESPQYVFQDITELEKSIR